MAAGVTMVVDYGLCNVDSMIRALEECGASTVEKTRDPRALDRADRIVLPGVGNFAAAMRNLSEWRLLEALQAAAAKSVPLLGACLGMQLMAKAGHEGAIEGTTQGIGLADGEVVPLVAHDADERIPHIGWNEVTARPDSVLFKGMPANPNFYFVHSYHLQLADEKDVGARTPYCGGFTAALELADRPVFGTQFHPEKSQKNGFQLLKNFLAV